MSVRTNSRRGPLKKSVKRVINAPRYVAYNDGLTNSISVPSFGPATVDFLLKLTVNFGPSAMGTDVNLLSDADGGVTERLNKSAGDTISFFYTDGGGMTRAIATSNTAVPGIEYDVVITSSSSGVRLTALGQSNLNANVIDPTDVNITRIGANAAGTTNFVEGVIQDVIFIDPNTATNSRYFPIDEGQGTRIRDAYGSGPTDGTGVLYTNSTWIEQ